MYPGQKKEGKTFSSELRDQELVKTIVLCEN